MTLREDCNKIVTYAINRVQPQQAVTRVLDGRDFSNGRLVVVSVGKAAWTMAAAAQSTLGDNIDSGIVITKYEHSRGSIGKLEIFEAGHPVPDQNSFAASRRALELTTGLTENDTVLFLLSGGGSALFEAPLIPEDELLQMTKDLLSCGADIVEMNTLRKRVSGVKGGRFALHCAPAKVFSIVLSDVLGDPLDMIASGPAHPDSSTVEDANRVIMKHGITLSDSTKELLKQETPKALCNVETVVTGSVRELCSAAAEACLELGYEPVFLTDCLACQAREAGAFLAAIAQSYQNSKRSIAFLAGGETVVTLTGTGLGGRNQEIALGAAEQLSGAINTAVFSFGSDGTDGPTDAAGGIVTGETYKKLKDQGIILFDVLQNNDAYHALQACDGLIITGATGTNVNDVSCVLIKRNQP